MKKNFIRVCLVFYALLLLGCGEISTLDFYKACLNGNEEVVNNYIAKEDISLELSEDDRTLFVNRLEKFDKEQLFLDYEDVFIENPIAVSILGGNISIIKTLCEKIPYTDHDADNIIYTMAKLNDTDVGIYLWEQGIFPMTYLPYIIMIKNDNIELFELYSTIIDDITSPCNNNTGENFLMIAAKEDAINCVKYLVDTKLFDINKLNQDYQTALDYAYLYEASNEVKSYLENEKGEYLNDTVKGLVRNFDFMTKEMEKLCNSSDYSYNDVLTTIKAFNYLCQDSELQMMNLPRNMSEWQKNILFTSMENMYVAFEKLLYLF